MIERLLFHRIDLQRGGGGVAQAVEFSALVDADEAEAALPVADVAMPRAQIAMHLVARFGFPPPRFVQGFSFLEDLQLLHRPSFADFPLAERLARASTLCAATIIRRFVEELKDRKSTRLNSSHGYISYAVFCLKKKNRTRQRACIGGVCTVSVRRIPS